MTLRLVPADANPAEFPPRRFACDDRAVGRFSPCPWCHALYVTCPGLQEAFNPRPRALSLEEEEAP